MGCTTPGVNRVLVLNCIIPVDFNSVSEEMAMSDVLNLVVELPEKISGGKYAILSDAGTSIMALAYSEKDAKIIAKALSVLRSTSTNPKGPPVPGPGSDKPLPPPEVVTGEQH